MTLPSAASLGLASIVHEREVSSTMDVAHELAAKGALAGTLVIADQQRAGRGRSGHSWVSEAGAGLWMTLIERPNDQRVVGVLALRLGMALADALEPHVDAVIRLKWPNDVFADQRKLAGILVEARWRDAQVDWVAIGMGINRRVPLEFPEAAAVRDGVSVNALLEAIIPRIREAVMRTGTLSADECAAWRSRDYALGRRVQLPLRGTVRGISTDGALLVETDTGQIESANAGSLIFS